MNTKLKYDDVMTRITKVKSIVTAISEDDLKDMFPTYKRITVLREMGLAESEIKATIDDLAIEAGAVVDDTEVVWESSHSRNHRLLENAIKDDPALLGEFAGAVVSLVQDALEQTATEYKDSIIVSIIDSLHGCKLRHGMDR